MMISRLLKFACITLIMLFADGAAGLSVAQETAQPVVRVMHANLSNLLIIIPYILTL